MLYLGGRRFIEALADGVHERSVDSPFAVDAVAVIWPRLAADQIGEGLLRGRRHIGMPYDFDSDLTRADRLVCTEVVYRSYEGIGAIRFDLTSRAARQILSAEDLFDLARPKRFFTSIVVFLTFVPGNVAFCPARRGRVPGDQGGLEPDSKLSFLSLKMA